MIIEYSDAEQVEVGTKIVCQMGHPVCEVVKTLVKNGVVPSGSFGKYEPGQHIARHGDQPSDTRCVHCGTNWFGHAIFEDSSIWTGIHTEHGWWPKPLQPFAQLIIKDTPR